MKFPDLIRSFTTQVLVGLWPFLCSARVQSEDDLTLAAQRARHALENADWATAEREYLKIVRLLPNSAEASNNLGIVYHQQKRFPDAIARFQRALSLNPDMIGPNFFMGVDYSKLRKYASAIGALNKACKQDSENVEARLYLSGVHSAMGEFDQAIEILSALADKYKEDVEILQTLGNAYLDSSQKLADKSEETSRAHFEKAKAAYAGVLRIAPNSSRAYQIEGRLASDRGLLDQAIQAYEKAALLEPDKPGLNFAVGDLYFRKTQYSAASPFLKKELEIDPYHSLARLDLGIIDIAGQHLHQAITHLKSAISLDPQLSEAHVALGQAYLGEDNLAAAMKAFEAAIKLDPHEPSGYYQLAQVYKKLGRLAEARQELEIFNRVANESRGKHTAKVRRFLKGQP